MTVYGFLLHLALAAACAMELRCSGLRFAALAVPPLRPPLRPRATAWGFFRGLRVLGCSFSPVAVSTTRRALANESESLLERFGMIEPDSHTQTGKSRGLKLKLAHYRQS
jgi:hypothetical protein